tara:strand:+ start:454 stop:603 length:150 start_codon:yes stop_codon:yes gene_type:complete
MHNNLEHVIGPYQLMIDLHKIIDENGVLVIKVPNDFNCATIIVNKKLYR